MKKTVISLLLLFAAVSSYAQNLNPQVQVTNDYQSAAPDIRKQDVPVSIPDSVLRFDYTFDYSVFDSPYKGAFEFTPYAIEFAPDKSPYGGHRLYVKAGAGYGLYPRFDAVYSPVPSGNYSMSIIQNLDGYYGNFWKVAPDMGVYHIIEKGYNLEENFAVEGRWGLSKSVVTWKADYDGIFFKDWMQNGAYHSAGLGLNAKSNHGASQSLFYDLNLFGRFASDIVSHPFSAPSLYETDIKLSGSIGPVLDKTYRVLLDYDLRYNRMDGNYAGRSLSEYALAPHVTLSAGAFSIDAGARLDYVGGRVSASPDILIYADAFKNAIRFYLGADGGQHAVTYSDFKRYNHYFTPAYTEEFQNVVREKVNAFAGFQGHIGSAFSYKTKASYAIMNGVPLETFSILNNTVLPSVSFENFNLFSADLVFTWESKQLRADGEFIYRKTSLDGRSAVFDLPTLSGNARVLYNYRSRISIGASLEGNSSRRMSLNEGEIVSVPMWLDLGAYAEYSFGPHLSVWARGGNLLNYFVRRDPFHVEQGINGTAGISFIL